MPNWFYYDVNGKKRGPINSAQLKSLADSQVINRNTDIETEDGRRGKAGQVKGLFSVRAPSPAGASSPAAPNSDQGTVSDNSSSKPRWFFFDANGVKQGPLTDEQVKSLINSEIISRDTFLETINGQRGKAGEVRKFFPSNQNSRPTHTADIFSRNNEKLVIISLLSGLLFIIVVIPFLFSLGSKSADELNQLGCRYLFGSDVEKDIPKGVQLIRKAAQKGSITGQSNLGILYYVGGSILEHDQKENAHYFSPSDYFSEGSIEQNYKSAYQWLSKAAGEGDEYAQFWLSRCYEEGHGVEKNSLMRDFYRKKAESQGYSSVVPLGTVEFIVFTFSSYGYTAFIKWDGTITIDTRKAAPK